MDEFKTELFRSGQWTIYTEHYHASDDADTVVMVNGALSTTTSFSATVRNLRGKVNMILFDLPFIGQSAPYNTASSIITKEDEVNILVELINHYRPEHLLSISWGGLAALMALAHRPPSLKSAIVASFSTRINDAMQSYLDRGKAYIEQGDFKQAAQLLNDEVGKHLPPLVQRLNYQHLSRLGSDTWQQVYFHINQLMALRQNDYVSLFTRINVPVLFVNGDQDEYTTAADIRSLENYLPHSDFKIIPGAGHFLELENKQVSAAVRELVLDYFCETKVMA